MGNHLDVVALGEPMIEFNQTQSGQPNAYVQGFGGDTSNMAIAAARLGARVGYVTRLGNDAFGRLFRNLWKTEGVDMRGVATDDEAPTGVYFVAHGEHGHEFSYLRAGSAASRMRPETLPLDLIRSARLLHVSGISQAISAGACDAVFAAIDAAAGAGALVTYDPNLRLKLWPLARARATILAAMSRCNWCLPSLDDAQLLFDSDNAMTVAAACHRAGAPGVVVKLGAAGCVVSDGTRQQHVPAHRVTPVDATGAGDCFDGAFATRLLAGDDPFAAAAYANVAAALATTGYGAVAPLPRDADVRAVMRDAAA
ncbi:MAG TPA: sugar kinase [Casimicrobiaceae bacterium]|nr:sugar kinase [Casimicrobiaceae bacterium]